MLLKIKTAIIMIFFSSLSFGFDSYEHKYIGNNVSIF